MINRGFAGANVSLLVERLELPVFGPFRCSQSASYLVDKEGPAAASRLPGLDWLLGRSGGLSRQP